MGLGPAASVRLFVCAVLLCAACAPIASGAPDPSAFNPFPTYGVAMAPAAFTSGHVDYTFTLSSGAYILYNATHYPITLVWGFYPVNKTGSGANNFAAAGSDIGQWKWDQKTSGSALSVGGWLDAPKKEAIETPISGSVSKQFTYGQLSFTGSAPVLGLHVSISVPTGKASPFGSGVTGDIIPTVVPEPATILALLFGLGGFALRRRR